MIKRFFKNLILRITSCVMAIVTLFSAGGCSLADVFAWMSDNGLSSPIDITSNVHKMYFNGGDGSAGAPYQIDNALQLYYFAWLQDLGLFNVDGDDEGTEIDTVYFVLTSNINMKDNETQYTLPPVGTTEYPFVGNFNGQGYTVSNLIVENDRDKLIEPPDGSENIEQYTEIIGFFGVVGSIDDKYKNEDGTYNYATQANAVTNLVIEDITIITQTARALVGFVAGYVNGTVDCVGVADGTVKVSSGTKSLSTTTENATTVLEGATNISDYSLIGYCTTNYKNELYVFGSSIAGPGTAKTYTVVLDNSSEGEGQGWGGSVKMSDIHTWLANSMGTTSGNYTYTYERTDFVGLDGTRTTTNRSSENRNSYSVDGFGAFVGSSMNWEGGINFVGGGQKVTENKYTSSSTETDDVYYIKDGDYYLNFNGNGITSQGTPTQWYRGITVDDEVVAGAIYTVTTDNKIYFLTMNNGNIGVIEERNADPANLPEWDFSNGKLSFDGTPIECNNGTWQEATTNTYLISNGSNYLSAELENNGDVNITNQTNSNSATKWTITTSGNTRTISTVIDEETYYLNVTPTGRNSATLTTTTTPTNWTYTNGQYRISANYNNQSRNYYIRYNRGWVGSNSGTTLTLTGIWDKTFAVEFTDAGTAATITFEINEYIDNSITNDYYNNGEKQSTGAAGISYLPLSKNENSYTVSNTNTGYIVGAEWGALEKGEGHDANDANIRISAYNASNITSPETPYTMTYKTEGTFKAIPDTSAETAKSLGLQKYTEKLRKDYTDSIQEYCYGLHFMEASVSESNKATITAKLKGQTIEGYEVPTNCIDFNLYESGFINFVAGSYYNQGNSVNNSFFSIYKIERKSDGKTIESIKEICKIYAQLNNSDDIDTTKPYYYTYLVDGTETGTGSIPSGYEMVFDCKWITHPNTSAYYQGNTAPNPTEWENNRAYYFEVPVNAGEYAIGSTKGRTGAYLVYLDLAANAQLLERAKDCEEIIENKTQVSIPVGKVDMLALEEGKEYTLDELKTILGKLDSFKTAFASITTSAGGGAPDSLNTIKVTRTGNTIKVITDSGGVIAEYIYEDSALTVDGDLMSIPITQTTTIVRTTYRDKNKTTGDLTVTVLTETTVVTKEPNGTTTTETTYTKTVTVTDKDGNPVKDKDGNSIDTDDTITDMKDFAPDTLDPTTGGESVQVGKKFIDLAFVYGAEVQLEISYSYQNGGFDSNDKPTGTYVITIKNPGKTDVTVKAILTQDAIASGITFIINGTALEKTNAAQTVTIEGENKANEPTDEPTE